VRKYKFIALKRSAYFFMIVTLSRSGSTVTNTIAGSTYSGSLTNLRFVWKAYNVYVNINKTDTTEHASEHNHNNENYEVDHTVVTYIIDKKFKIREAFYGVPPLWNSDDMVHDVSVLAKS